MPEGAKGPENRPDASLDAVLRMQRQNAERRQRRGIILYKEP